MSFQTKVTPEIRELADSCVASTGIESSLYREFEVKKGLRDLDGKGVLAGLTNVSSIISFREENGKRVPIPGELRYRGIDINALTRGFMSEGRFGFAETAYLLLFGRLPERLVVSAPGTEENENGVQPYLHLLRQRVSQVLTLLLRKP